MVKYTAAYLAGTFCTREDCSVYHSISVQYRVIITVIIVIKLSVCSIAVIKGQCAIVVHIIF